MKRLGDASVGLYSVSPMSYVIGAFRARSRLAKVCGIA